MPKPDPRLRAIADARRSVVRTGLELEIAKTNHKTAKAVLEIAVLEAAMEADRQLGLPIDELRDAREKARAVAGE